MGSSPNVDVSFASLGGSHLRKSILKSNHRLSSCSQCSFQVMLPLFQKSLRRNVEVGDRESGLSMVQAMVCVW